jgi:hypothetical protein
MSTATKRLSQTVSEDEQRRRADAVRAGIASARVEGGDVGPEAQAIMNQWAEGLIDDETMGARIDALHVT